MKEKKLKPVTFVKGEIGYYRDNKFQQNLLLKAMQTTDNPNELRKAIGVRAVADVVRTLDKLTIRQEYHDSLFRNGVSLDFIVENIKNIAITSPQDATRLKALQVLLRSVGLERYEDIEDKGKGWEELLVETQQKQLNGEDAEDIQLDGEDYEVTVPPVPEAEKQRIENEREFGKNLYAE